MNIKDLNATQWVKTYEIPPTDDKIIWPVISAIQDKFIFVIQGSDTIKNIVKNDPQLSSYFFTLENNCEPEPQKYFVQISANNNNGGKYSLKVFML